MKGSEGLYSGVLISAPQGRSGKTIASLALCAILRKRGFSIQPFKKGPDYIDPSWLSAAAGRICRNLDPFMMSGGVILASYQKAFEGADLSVIEGAMGLYDGLESDGWGSTAHLANILKLPVILVVNTIRMTGSIAALVSGYQHFQPGVNIAAVILNNVSGDRHVSKLVTAVEGHCGIPVVGRIPRDTTLHMTQRHLGHIPFSENNEAESIIERIGQKLDSCFDMDAILEIAGTSSCSFQPPATLTDSNVGVGTVRIGVIRDQVFNFYYPENLVALQQAGAELVFINSIADRLPEVDGLCIGGGFPEFFLKELEANRDLREDIAYAIEDNMPVYAECAGLMYLCRGIRWQNQRHEMVGIIPAEVELSHRPQGHGYVEAEVVEDNPLFPKGVNIRGHEFHHSKLTKLGDLEFAYRIKRGHGISGSSDGIIYKNTFAAYTHLHALGMPEWAESFVGLALRERKCRPLVAASYS